MKRKGAKRQRSPDTDNVEQPKCKRQDVADCAGGDGDGGNDEFVTVRAKKAKRPSFLPNTAAVKQPLTMAHIRDLGVAHGLALVPCSALRTLTHP